MDVHIQLDPNPMKSIAKIQLDIGQYHIQSQEYLWLVLEYIRDISILGRLWLYPYPTRSVGEAPCPPSHVPLYIQPQGSG